MGKTSVRKTWGEREGVTLELLQKFTKPGDPNFGDVKCVWSYGGDGTESGDRQLRKLLPEGAYEHLHWNTVACTGGVLVVVPRWKSGEDRGRGPGLRSEYYWAMDEITQDEADPRCGIRPATQEEIEALVPDTRDLLMELPGLEYMAIERVSFYSTARRGKQFRDAPKDVRFFRFAAGYGCVAITRSAGQG